MSMDLAVMFLFINNLTDCVMACASAWGSFMKRINSLGIFLNGSFRNLSFMKTYYGEENVPKNVKDENFLKVRILPKYPSQDCVSTGFNHFNQIITLLSP